MASLTTTLFPRRWLRHLPELLVALDVNGRSLTRHRAIVLVAQIDPLAAERAVGASAIVHADILGEINRRTRASSMSLTMISVTRTSGSTRRVIGCHGGEPERNVRWIPPRRFASLRIGISRSQIRTGRFDVLLVGQQIRLLAAGGAIRTAARGRRWSVGPPVTGHGELRPWEGRLWNSDSSRLRSASGAAPRFSTAISSCETMVTGITSGAPASSHPMSE